MIQGLVEIGGWYRDGECGMVRMVQGLVDCAGLEKGFGSVRVMGHHPTRHRKKVRASVR